MTSSCASAAAWKISTAEAIETTASHSGSSGLPVVCGASGRAAATACQPQCRKPARMRLPPVVSASTASSTGARSGEMAVAASRRAERKAAMRASTAVEKREPGDTRIA
jgi:hypothetical protein